MIDRRRIPKNRLYSISKNLKEKGFSNDNFETMLNRLSLEEIIALKLELCSKFSFNSKMYNLPIWKKMPWIARDAVLKAALSITKSKKQAASFLGINPKQFNARTKKFKTHSYLEEEVQTMKEKE